MTQHQDLERFELFRAPAIGGCFGAPERADLFEHEDGDWVRYEHALAAIERERERGDHWKESRDRHAAHAAELVDRCVTAEALADRHREALEEEVEAAEFFLSSAEKFNKPEPYGMRCLLNRLNAHLQTNDQGGENGVHGQDREGQGRGDRAVAPSDPATPAADQDARGRAADQFSRSGSGALGCAGRADSLSKPSKKLNDQGGSPVGAGRGSEPANGVSRGGLRFGGSAAAVPSSDKTSADPTSSDPEGGDDSEREATPRHGAVQPQITVVERPEAEEETSLGAETSEAEDWRCPRCDAPLHDGDPEGQPIPVCPNCGPFPASQLLPDMLDVWAGWIESGEGMQDTNAHLCGDDLRKAARLLRAAPPQDQTAFVDKAIEEFEGRAEKYDRRRSESKERERQDGHAYPATVNFYEGKRDAYLHAVQYLRSELGRGRS